MAKIYSVGGSVRDRLLGLPISDRDWVVIGSTPEEMLEQGYTLIGKDFPVFLHPETHEEYALARTEKKIAKGYTGFQVYSTPNVTLEEDLQRRDFTINAIAEDAEGNLIDPYGGQSDLKAGILRHVSDAFTEDPVRILRAARFIARFGFSLAPETLELMTSMVASGEVDSLVAERIWQELSRGLMEKSPSLFFTTLRQCGALKKIFPEIDALFGVPQTEKFHPEIDTGIHTLLVVDNTAKNNYSLAVRFAALTHDLGKSTTPAEILPGHKGHEMRSVHILKSLCKRLRVPVQYSEIAQLVAKYHSDIHRARSLSAESIIKLFDCCDLWRKPDRFKLILQACESDAHGRTGHEFDEYPQAEYLHRCANAALSVNAGAIALNCSEQFRIPAEIFTARVEAIKELSLNI